MKHSEKNEMRKRLLQARNALAKQKREEMEREILDSLRKLPEWEMAKTVYSYVSFGSEVSTYSFLETCLQSGKKVAVPKMLGKGWMEFFYISSFEELYKNFLGIFEPEGRNEFLATIEKRPVSKERPLFIMPGIGFDKSFHRLGYGGGFYDRYLAKYGAERFLKIALSFPVQIVEEVPNTEHDVAIDLLVTAENIWRRETYG